MWTKAIFWRYHVGLNGDNPYNVKSLWEEQASVNDESKCDKITVHLSQEDDKSNENIVTVIIYISTGRIQFQGKCLLEWGDSEFMSLLKIVNSIPTREISPESSTQDLGKFVDLISTSKPLIQTQEKVNQIETDNNTNDPTTTENAAEIQTCVNSPAREKILHHSKEHCCKCQIRIYVIQRRGSEILCGNPWYT